MKQVAPTTTLGRNPLAVTPGDSATANPSISSASDAGNADKQSKRQQQLQQQLNHTGPQYLSAVTRVDPQTGVAVLAMRDVDNGNILDQHPSRQVVDEYQRLIKERDKAAMAGPSGASAAGQGGSAGNNANANGNNSAGAGSSSGPSGVRTA